MYQAVVHLAHLIKKETIWCFSFFNSFFPYFRILILVANWPVRFLIGDFIVFPHLCCNSKLNQIIVFVLGLPSLGK